MEWGKGVGCNAVEWSGVRSGMMVAALVRY